MLLFLVQHAEALSKEEDPSRSLSEQGVENMKKVSSYVSRMNMDVHQILHSGKMRALQTAQILAEYLPDVYVSETDGLAPRDNPGIWLERVSKLNNNIILVGHLPHLAKLLSLLVSGEEKNLVNFENGCVICIRSGDEGSWALEWIVKPEMAV